MPTFTSPKQVIVTEGGGGSMAAIAAVLVIAAAASVVGSVIGDIIWSVAAALMVLVVAGLGTLAWILRRDRCQFPAPPSLLSLADVQARQVQAAQARQLAPSATVIPGQVLSERPALRRP